ncbi:MAG: 1-acyl-sn-glycerol-3-phosphate acyltransferase [Chloroflexi bacterium]|jgi:1-acyl-sn-glycerol-3-phosphate acyltransferase|nr:1-acyl-sn-glycerol-3-phosphate acyltransferase [Chloroflexota bacterium]
MKSNLGYRLVHRGAKILTVLLARVEVQGWENLPRQGAYIATANHLGRLEIVLVYYLLDREDVILIIAEKYRQSGFWRWLARQVNGIFIDRYNADISALREVIKRLKQGGVLAIAPEGTRSKSGVMLEGHFGAAYLASKSGVPIVPVGVTGSEDEVVLQGFKRLKRARVILKIGKPYTLPPLNNRDRENQLKQSTDEIMCQIAALLPESYWGHYTNFPRVQEIIQQYLNSAPMD